VSLRLRLLLASLTTLAVGLGAPLVIANVLLAHRVHSETSTVLRANADAQVAALSVTSKGVAVRTPPNDATLDRRSWVLDGDRVIERPAGASPQLDRAAVALGRRGRVTEVDGPGDTRLRSEPVLRPGSRTPAGSVVVALSLESLERLQQEVLLGSLVIAALVLLAGGLAIRSALNGALRPVAQMTSTAEDWGARDLDRRFDLGPARDELTALAATLDHLLARIAASRRHEQRFASEVAHELRTPLAGLRARAELALGASGPATAAEREEALRAVVAQASRLDHAIDALIALARQEIDPSSGTVDLAVLARELDDVEVSAPAYLPVAEGDAEVVRRALAPLVDNARRHARVSVAIALSAEAGRVRLAVRDDGPGLDPDLGERAFEPGVRGQDEAGGGAGLGLALARRLARSCGGDIVIGPGPGGCFVLELPALGPGADDPMA
jgi:signal transduction histidine kinase